MSAFITMKNISKTYTIKGQTSIEALREVDLEIVKGEMIAISGVSGSGKSTLLHILGCLDTPTAGEFFVEDIDITKLNDKKLSRVRNKMVGFVLQDFALIPYRTALENVSVPLFFGSTPYRLIKKYSTESMAKIGIEDLSARKVSQMSGGQKQRVALARALANNPDIILADEPTGALDSKTKEEILEVFKQIHAMGKTIVIVTHDPEVAQIADRVLHMADGKILNQVNQRV